MSINYTINETVTTPLRTDILADCGWDKYHIYSSLLREHYTIGNDTICDAEYSRNPVVANQMIFFGDAYYTALTFDNPAISTLVYTSLGYRIIIIRDIILEYRQSASLLYVRCFGTIRAGTSGSSSWSGYLGAYKLNGISDIDFSKPFMFHWTNIPMKDNEGSLAECICTKAMVTELMREGSTYLPTFIYDYIDQYFAGGGLSVFTVCDSPDGFNYDRGLRISYINTSGQPVDLPYDQFLIQDYATYINVTGIRIWIASLFQSYNLIIPMTINEYDASASANYKYNDWPSLEVEMLKCT